MVTGVALTVNTRPWWSCQPQVVHQLASNCNLSLTMSRCPTTHTLTRQESLIPSGSAQPRTLPSRSSPVAPLTAGGTGALARRSRARTWEESSTITPTPTCRVWVRGRARRSLSTPCEYAIAGTALQGQRVAKISLLVPKKGAKSDATTN